MEEKAGSKQSILCFYSGQKLNRGTVIGSKGQKVPIVDLLVSNIENDQICNTLSCRSYIVTDPALIGDSTGLLTILSNDGQIVLCA